MEQDELDALNRQNAESWKRQSETAAAALKLQQDQAAMLATPDQENWLRLYDMHLRIRLGPTVITSTTGDTVIDDIVKDATRMTQVAWPLVKSELDKLA